MLVTNPAARAPLPEVLTHPWMLRGFNGPADSHLVHREPLRADELDRQVIKGMKGFEFGSEDFIEKKLIKVLESDAYIRAVQNWERQRDGSGYGGRNGVSNSSLSISLEGYGHPPVSPSGAGTKSKSRRFSGFDFYRRKLFSPASSPPGSPLSGNSPPNSQSHLSTLSLGDANREPIDPTRGFHPLISMYYLAREKMERERVYGPGHFASSQLSLQENDAAAAEPTPNDANGSSVAKITSPKVDYGMVLPHLPPPETIHQSGMSYNATPTTPSPTSPGFGQPRARDSGLPVNKNAEVSNLPSATLPSNGSTATPKAGLPRAPPASTHRRSHSLSQRPTVLGNRWGMFGEKEVVEHGSLTNEMREPPRTAGPETTTFTEKTESRPSNDGSLNTGAGATLARKFGSLLSGRGDGSGRHSVNKRGTILGGLSPRPSGESDPEKKNSSEQPASGKTSPVPPSDKAKDDEIGRKAPTPTPPKSISHSQSQPLSTVHRRAATILDTSGRNTRHERRSSTGGALLPIPGGGTIGRHRRPSTGYGTSTRPSGGLFGKTVEVDEVREAEEGVEDAAANGNGKAENFGEEGERHTSEKDFKPVFLKGLFR